MKSTKLLLPLAFAALLFSCDDADNTIDNVLNNVERGAVLRTVSTASNSIPIAIENGTVNIPDDAGLNIVIEQQDADGGALLESVDVFVQFADGSADEGDSAGATTTEVFLKTLSASDFSPGPFGLPRTNLNVTAAEMLSAVNLTPSALFGGDTFTTRLAMKLTDGREFSSDNAGGIITGGFFASPFQYVTSVVCNLPTDTFVGDYLIEEITPLVDGPTLADGTVITLERGESDDTIRTFGTTNYPAYCGTINPFTLQFVCGEITIPTQNSVCACSSGAGFFGPADVVENYDITDDSTFLVSFLNDVETDCGPPVVTTYRFTKQ